MKVERILFPTDFSRCAGQALPHALFLARSFDAEVHMLHAIVLLDEDPHDPGAHFPDPEQIAAELREIAAARMRADLASAPGGLTVHEEQRRGVSVATVVLDYADEIAADLIVIGTHGRRGLGHLLLGSATEEIVRHATCPVMTVRESREEPRVDALDRILVPIDFSAPSRRALATARELAQRYGASLQLLHVVEEAIVPEFYMQGRVVEPVLAGELRERARARLAALFEDTGGPAVPMETFAIEGRAWHAIGDFALETNSDLIVISSHGLTGLARALLGSVAERVVRSAPCPVLTLRVMPGGEDSGAARPVARTGS
jgi:nucleotide-binding universal stress UspA family protein